MSRHCEQTLIIHLRNSRSQPRVASHVEAVRAPMMALKTPTRAKITNAAPAAVARAWIDEAIAFAPMPTPTRAAAAARQADHHGEGIICRPRRQKRSICRRCAAGETACSKSCSGS
jgi:hypothetical protein